MQSRVTRNGLLAMLACALDCAAMLPLGAPVSEPGLKGRADILYFQDFEGSGDTWKEDVQVSKPYLRPSSHVAFKGSMSLRVRFAAEGNTPATWPREANHYGGTVHFRFAKNGLDEPEEIYFRYYLYIPDETGRFSFPDKAIWDPRYWERDESGYSPKANGEYRPLESADKMPGFGGRYAGEKWGGAGTGLRHPDGTNGWSARMSLKERPGDSGYWDIRYYVYHLENGTDGNHGTLTWDADLERERWHCIEGYIKLNTIRAEGGRMRGASDGILRGWVDGALAFERTDLVFRHHPRLRIEEIYGNFHIGGGWFPIKDCFLFTDNWVIARKPIGPYGD